MGTLTVNIRDDFWENDQWPLNTGWPVYTGPLYTGWPLYTGPLYTGLTVLIKNQPPLTLLSHPVILKCTILWCDNPFL